MSVIDLPMPYNPALPDERRRLAAEVLRAGTALALDVPRAVAVQAERDALYLCLLHGPPWKALRRTGRGRLRRKAA